MNKTMQEEKEFFEWVSAAELKEIDWPLCIKYDGGGAPAYDTVCSMKELLSYVSHFNPIEQIEYLKPITKAALNPAEEISDSDIRKLAEEYYGNDINSFGQQRAGYIQGYKAALNKQ